MFSFIYLVLLATVTVVAAELLVRLRGIEPWIVPDLPIHVTPGGRFYATHRTGLYSSSWGVCRDLTRGVAVHRHAPRIRSVTALPTDAHEHTTPEISIFGCSFTHGWSLNDQETYPGASRSASRAMRW